AWVSIHAELLPVDTSASGVLPSVRPAIGLPRTPRCPRTSAHRLPPPRRWRRSTSTHGAARPDGTACRTEHRTDSRALSSLWHATLPPASEPSVKVLGSRQSPGSRRFLR